MKLPMQITFKNMERSDWVEDAVRKHAEKLDSFFEGIMSCRVVVETPHKHHRKGNLYQVRIDLTVPGEEIVVNKEAGEHAAYQDIKVAIRESFDAAKRLLEDYVRRRRRLVKTHEEPPHARVVRVFPEQDYGFLETFDGREIYFHRNSVLDEKLEDVAVGTEVTFVEEPGEKGPQASTVRVIRQRRKAG